MAQDEPSTLSEWSEPDDSREVLPPNVTKRKPILLPETKRQVGSLVWDAEREWNAYLSSRTQAENLFKIHNAYPISVSLLGRLQHYDVERVLIAVRDDEDYGHGTVYEFELDAYLPENSPTYVWERDDGDDTQVCPDKDDAAYIWPNIGSDLFK